MALKTFGGTGPLWVRDYATFVTPTIFGANCEAIINFRHALDVGRNLGGVSKAIIHLPWSEAVPAPATALPNGDSVQFGYPSVSVAVALISAMPEFCDRVFAVIGGARTANGPCYTPVNFISSDKTTKKEAIMNMDEVAIIYQNDGSTTEMTMISRGGSIMQLAAIDGAAYGPSDVLRASLACGGSLIEDFIARPTATLGSIPPDYNFGVTIRGVPS